MCTVTAVPRSQLASPAWATDPLLLRLVCNRDESRSRAEALSPVLQTIDGVTELRELVQKRNTLDETQVAAAQLVFKWGGWASGVLLIILSLWSGKMQAVLEGALKLFGQRP